jgi:hypothetical protein
VSPTGLVDARAVLVEYDAGQSEQQRITRKDLERLRTTGIIVKADDIESLDNGIFTYQGVPVLLYIYQPMHWTEQDDRLPRYHLCNCRTWRDMKTKGRQDRYVASTRIDGVFELEVFIAARGASQKKMERLPVCQNCLDRLGWKGFRNDGSLTRNERRSHVEGFALDEFFAHYRKSMVREKPRWTASTMPTASYSDDFDEVSSRARAAAQWRCQHPECGRVLAASWQRRYLHVHHRNGVKGDNSADNLFVICIEHHAKQPNHEHLKSGRDYVEFMELFNGQGAVQRERLAARRAGSGTAVSRSQSKRKRSSLQGDEIRRSSSQMVQRRLVDRLRTANLTFMDKRPKGCLWVIGDAKLKPLFDALGTDGIVFTFAARGGHTTGFRPGWFTTSTR